MTVSTPDDPALLHAIERWRAGEREGMAVIYAACFPLVREIVHLRLGQPLRVAVDSTDIVQDAFVGLLRAPPPDGVRTGRELVAYLATAVLNRTREVHRAFASGKRDRRREQGAEVGRPDWLPAGGPTPSQVSMGREAYERYLAAVATLPAREREAVVLARHVGLSAMESADALALETPGAFRALLSRALAKVSLAMQERGGEAAHAGG